MHKKFQIVLIAKCMCANGKCIESAPLGRQEQQQQQLVSYVYTSIYLQQQL